MLVTQDVGKTLDDARAEVGRGIESVEAAMAAPHLLKGQTLEGIATGVDVESFLQPVGVVAAITPFNFPAVIPMWFLPFALACGNTFVLKPSEHVPLTAERYVELIDDIPEFPAGAVNLVHGAHEAVDALLDHPGVDAISFVGSAQTARYVARRAVETGKRVQALAGAKNAFIVMPDADAVAFVTGVMGSAFGAAGQRCMAGSVAVLVGSRAEQDERLKSLIAAASQLRVGSGMDADTDVSPLISAQARTRLIEEIASAQDDGIRVALDGRHIPAGDGEAQLGPTILDDVRPDHRVATVELFGPVLAIVRVGDLDEALAFTNASRYGNSTILFTESGGVAREFRRRAQAGMLGVNIGVAAPIAWMPFGGWKDSIDADLSANGDDAFRFYTRQKVVTSRWASSTGGAATVGGMQF